MYGERFPLPRGNPRLFPEDRPSPPLLSDRFRAMVRLREEDLAVDDDDEPPPALTTPEIVRIYEEVLSDLTVNSKPIISELTMIASEQREHAQGIADAICNRILNVPVDQKLPSLYLLDSIAKNIGREYLRRFSARLPKVFCVAYNQVNSSLHPAMRHLLGTWSQVFHPSVLCKIEDELQYSTPMNQRSTGLVDMRHSESPSHGIHVNPKYLEARHQFDHSAAMRVIVSRNDADMINFEGEQIERNASESPKGWSGASPKFHDVQHLRGVSSILEVYGQKPYSQYADNDFDDTELLSSRHETARAGSPQTAAMRASSMVGVVGKLPCLKRRVSKSPPRIGLRRSVSPADDRFQGDISFRRVERASPSHSGHEHGRESDKNGWRDRRWPSDDGAQPQANSIGCGQINGCTKRRSRELIDTYGSHSETGNYQEKCPKLQPLDVVGINSEATTSNWKSSEEEEWEDMSPTFADCKRSTLQPFRPFNGRPGLSRAGDGILEPDFRSGWADQTSQSPFIDEDKIPSLHSGHGSINKKYLDGAESQNESLLHYKSSNKLQEPGNPYRLPQYSQQSRSPKSQGRVLQGPYSVSGPMSSIGQNLRDPYDNLPDAEVSFGRLPSIHSDHLNVPAIEKHWAQRPYSPPCPAPVIWRPLQNSHPLPLVARPPNQKQHISPCEFIDGNMPELNEHPNSSLFWPRQHYGATDSKTTTLSKPPQLNYEGPGSFHLRRHSQELGTTRTQSQEAHGSFIPLAQPQLPSHVQTRGQCVVTGPEFTNSLSGVPSSAGMQRISDTTFHAHDGMLPPIPPGSHPASSQMGSGTAFSGLMSTLMAQGLISLMPPGQSQDSVGVDFNAELLKVRHESAINALYTYLPRQCTTCGLRFKCQEEHSSHMDWHVTKNRISKNHKQKPSRKWFVSGKEWLSGAEILGTDVIPGFLSTEPVTEREDTEMAVPADENQNVCALCGECFEDFYSDETEEWMYRSAVYLNAPNGNIEGMDRSECGPIVHAKCRPESAEDVGQSQG